MTIGEALKRFRKEYQLRQDDVAEKIKVTRQAYHYYETDKGTPPSQKILDLANAYNVSTDYLLGRSDEPRPVTHTEKEIREAFEFRDRWQSLLQAASAQGLLPQPAATA